MSRRVLKGIVVSDRCDKTVTVQVVNKVMHPKYKKYIKTRKKYAAHDENNFFKIGDKVKIIESKPISKSKRWIVLNKDGGAL